MKRKLYFEKPKFRATSRRQFLHRFHFRLFGFNFEFSVYKWVSTRFYKEHVLPKLKTGIIGSISGFKVFTTKKDD